MLTGVVPLVRTRTLGVDRFTFLGQGTPCADHLDLVVAPGIEPEAIASVRACSPAPGRACSMLCSAAAVAFKGCTYHWCAPVAVLIPH